MRFGPAAVLLIDLVAGRNPRRRSYPREPRFFVTPAEPEPPVDRSVIGTVVGWRGTGVVLEAPDDVLEAFLSHLPAFYENAGEPVATAEFTLTGESLTVTLPDGLTVTGPFDASTMRAAASRIELLVVERLRATTAIHAGVVSFGARAVVLPGRSMAGKSTLVRALVDAGGTYLSDEYALIEYSGRVAAYPRRMTIRTRDGNQRVDAARAADVDMPSIPIHLVASLIYAAEGWSVEQATQASAVMDLVSNSLNARHDPEGAMIALTSAVSQATCITGTRGEAIEAAALIRAML